MILVVTGTHEQPFDRLVAAADSVAKSGTPFGKVIIQYGPSRVPLQAATGLPMYGIPELARLADEAALIVTHGGPGSIWLAFERGKVPIAMPRQRRYGEHVDDHQVRFVMHLGAMRRIVPVVEAEQLGEAVSNFRELERQCVAPATRGREGRETARRVLDQWMRGR